MATLAAVNQVGESIVGLLRARRDLLAAEGNLAPVPNALDISHLSLGRLATMAEPTSGLTITCYRLAMSDHPTPRTTSRRPETGATIALDLHYLMAAWPSGTADEQAIMTRAMLAWIARPNVTRWTGLVTTRLWTSGPMSAPARWPNRNSTSDSEKCTDRWFA